MVTPSKFLEESKEEKQRTYGFNNWFSRGPDKDFTQICSPCLSVLNSYLWMCRSKAVGRNKSRKCKASLKAPSISEWKCHLEPRPS